MSPLPQDGHLQDKSSPSLGLIQEETEVINSIMGNGISYPYFVKVFDGVSQHVPFYVFSCNCVAGFVLQCSTIFPQFTPFVVIQLGITSEYRYTKIDVCAQLGKISTTSHMWGFVEMMLRLLVTHRWDWVKSDLFTKNAL